MANKPNGTLYIGITNNLERRISEHRNGEIDGFTKEHGLKMLVWYEEFTDIRDAIHCEKLMKKWHREWKINAIVKMNSDWKDLSLDWYHL